MTLTFVHTAEVHRVTFDALRDQIAPGTDITHIVRPEWLARAQTGVDPALEQEIKDEIGQMTGPVVCTCTTIGAVAEEAGAIRVDWPMMQKAAKTGGPIMFAYCLDSTYQPSLSLLDRALEEAGMPTKVHAMPLGQYWPLFEAGQNEAFAAVLASEIRGMVEHKRDIACVILAQASMAGAAALLSDLPIPVFSSPEFAFRAGFAAM
ncbi:hypothetical protein ROA7450_01060 [Roseovarius albus]|uniref:Asp/Glu/Hydantoin racemase n=1 Tax=Roseovarius albus TaxID=1247867 RepID=A0A1X6YMD3_9RHOB|nr:hypothetical protein [Roseovarius albus]SLN25697.1 hypothetical protein ROA7450_01060 [Roseovarius albus]